MCRGLAYLSLIQILLKANNYTNNKAKYCQAKIIVFVLGGRKKQKEREKKKRTGSSGEEEGGKAIRKKAKKGKVIQLLALNCKSCVHSTFKTNLHSLLYY